MGEREGDDGEGLVTECDALSQRCQCGSSREREWTTQLRDGSVGLSHEEPSR